MLLLACSSPPAAMVGDAAPPYAGPPAVDLLTAVSVCQASFQQTLQTFGQQVTALLQ
jgi:hypothetical protein